MLFFFAWTAGDPQCRCHEGALGVSICGLASQAGPTWLLTPHTVIAAPAGLPSDGYFVTPACQTTQPSIEMVGCAGEIPLV